MSNLPPPSFDPPSPGQPGSDQPPSTTPTFAPPDPTIPAASTVPAASTAAAPSGPPPMIDDRGRTKKIVAGLVVLALVLVGLLLALTLGGDDDATSADTTVAVDETDAPDPRPTEPDPTVAPTTSTPAFTLPTASPTTVPTTPPTSTVDLGNGVSFTVPDGYTSEPAGNGIEITDGNVRFFAQVEVRAAGIEPLTLAQEYIDGFDANFAAATYSQAIPAGPDADGVSDSDGYFIYYRVLDADGSGFSGLIDASRRADGLVYVTDTYRPIDDTSGDRVPADVYDEFYGSYLAAPVVGTEVPLTPLTSARVNSVHAAYPLDGVVALSPPPAWTVDGPGPLRVSFGRSDGQRFVAARLADTADVLVAQDLAFAELQRVVPGATIDGFEPRVEGDDQSVVSFESLIAATAPDGRAIEGIVRVWTDAQRSQVFSGISFNFVDTPPSLLEENFLLNALDISLVEDR